MKPRMIGVVVLSLIVAVPAGATAGDPQNGEGHGNKASKEHGRGRTESDSGIDVSIRYFQPREVEIIHEYYGPYYGSLPPGLAKKYYRTGHLPPGWQKKMVPLPVALDRRLGPLPADYRRGYIEGSVVLYSPGSDVVIDVVAPLGR